MSDKTDRYILFKLFGKLICYRVADLSPEYYSYLTKGLGVKPVKLTPVKSKSLITGKNTARKMALEEAIETLENYQDLLPLNEQVAVNVVRKCFEETKEHFTATGTIKDEVVRCKNCKRWAPTNGYGYDLDGTKQQYGRCSVTNFFHKENHFCSYGKKKEGVGK